MNDNDMTLVISTVFLILFLACAVSYDVATHKIANPLAPAGSVFP